MSEKIDWDKGDIKPPAGLAENTDWESGEIKPPAPNKGMGGFLRDAGLSLAKGVVAVPEAVVGLADIATGGRVGKALENEGGAVGFRPKQAKEFLGDLHTEKYKDQQQQFQEADGILEKTGVALSNPSMIANAVVESVPVMGMGGAMGRAGLAAGRGMGAFANPTTAAQAARQAAVAGAAGEGVSMAGSQAEAIRQETADGLLTPTQSGAAALTGLVGGAVGAGSARLARYLGIGDADTMLAQGTSGMAKQFADDAATAAANAGAKPTIKSIPRKMIEGAITEGFLEELPQSMAETVLQNLALGKPWHEKLDEAAVMGVLTGGAMGAGAAGFHGFKEPTAAPGAGVAAVAGAPAEPEPDNSMAAVREQWLARAQQLREAETGEALPPQTPAPDGAALLAAQRAQQEQARLAEQAQNRAIETADDEIYQSTGFADRAPVQRPSEAMGLDPNAGGMSAAAALAVDSGATDQMAQMAQAQAQAELDAKGGKKSADKGALESAATLAAPTVDADGVIADAGPAVYPTYEDAQANAMSQRRNGATVTGLPVPAEGGGFTLAMKGTPQYPLGEALRAERMQAERQAKASTNQQEKAPLSQDTQALPATNIVAPAANLKSITAKQIPAMTDVELQQAIEHYGPEHKRTANLQKEVQRRAADTPTTLTGAFDGPQADQTQQTSAQPAQAAAPAAAAGLTDGAPTENPRAQAAPAAGAQGAAPAETKEQRTQRVAAAGEAWTRMPTVEREAMAGRADGLNPMQRKSVQRAAWADLSADIQRKLADAMNGRAEIGMNTAPAAATQQAAPVAEQAAPKPDSTVTTMRSLAQQFRDRHAVTKKDTDRTFAGVLDQFAQDVEQGKRTPQSVQQAIERYQELAAEPFQATQTAPATHADPGQAPEVATPAVVAQSVQKAARNEDTKPSEMRKWLVGKIDEAIAVAPEAAVDFLSFDVPGDGTFKVQNSQARLQEFRKKVMTSPGFKDGGQKQNTKPLEQVDSAINGSGSTVEAIRNFLTDGDVQGAIEFAKLKGVEFTPVEPRASMTANGKFKRVPASVKSSVPSVAEGLTQVEAEQINQYLTAENAIAEQNALQSPQDGNQAYSDGQQLGADDLLAYFDQVIAGSQKGEKIVNPRFQIGAVDAGTAQEIANYIDGYDGQQRNLRVSGRTLKHIHESRPAIAREIVGQLPGMFSKPDEVLPDPKHKNKRALLVNERQTEEGQSKPKSYVATVEVEIEIEVKDGFIDIVTIMTAPERSLKEARELKKNWPEGQRRTEQAVNSPHPLTAEAANPAADSPDARPAGVSVPPTGTTAQPITRADVTAAQQQAAAIITERIDAMTAGEVNTIARRFLPTMGVRPTVSKERNKAAVVDFTKVNPMAAAEEFGATLPADVRRALQADMEGRVADAGQDDGVNPRVPRENRAPAKAPTQVEQKEPWQMTALEFSQQPSGNPHWNKSYAGKDDGAYLADTAATHALLVRDAVAAGKLPEGAKAESNASAAPQADTPKLTPAEAKSLMAWEDLGQKNGVKTHALTFYESQADKDAKRGRMIVAKVSKEVDSGNWTVEGTGEKLAVLGMAKKKAEQVGMEKAVADGFVEQAVEAPKSTAKPAAAATNSAPIEDAGDKLAGTIKTKETDKGAAMFSRTGAKSPNAQQPTTRAWYDRFVSLLPASYRNDPHRREPFPAEDWNVQRASEVRSKVEALNKQLRGADDRKGYGPVSVDGLGNLQVDARSVSAADLSGLIRALADELGAGVAATNVRSGDVRALLGEGFVSETSLAAIADRLMGRPFAQPVNTYTKDSAPGTILTYKPRGFPAALFSRSATPSADSNERNVATQMLVDGLKENWTRSPDVIVARNMQDPQVPQAVRDYDETLKSQGATGEPRGFIYKGKVYLLSDQLKGPQQIAEVLFHEVLGHYGLRGVFGKGLDSILQQMGTMRRKEVVAKAREYGLFDKDALGGLDKKTASDAQIWAAMSAKDRLSAAEEVLAEMAQTQPTIGFVQRAIAAIRNWLRANVPGFKSLRLTDADIIQAYILPARGFVTRSKETGAQSLERAMAAFSRTPGDQTQTEAFKRWFKDSKAVDAQTGKPLVVYHGTGADFAVFSLDKTGSNTDSGMFGAGFYFATSPAESSRYARGDAPSIKPVYLSLQNPFETSNAADLPAIPEPETIEEMAMADKLYSDQLRAELIKRGHDGVIFTRKDGAKEFVAFYPEQIKSSIGNNGNFDPANPDIRFSRTTAQSIASSMGDMTPDQEKAYKNVAGVKAVPTVRERMDALKANLGLKLRQGLVDQFAAIKQLDQNAYVQARMSKGTDGTLEAILMYGKPFMRDGAPDVDIKDGGFAKVLASLKGEQDRWMMWIAAQRAEKLKAEGKENLMTDDDISALKTLNAGKMADGTARVLIYAKALQELNAYNDAMLKLAMDSGLIDQAAYDLMAGQPYVPFYRLMEDGDMKGPKFSSGLTNQKAWQKLKGGTQQLNADLLQNMLLNWSHLLQASAKNRAATATMDAAEKMAVAYKVDADTKGSVKVMRDGSAEHWMVEDPYLLDAISAIHYVPSPLMKPLAKFKQLLTWGVTVNPTFKIRNLIRDSVSAIAQADLGYNPAGNVAKGWKLTAKDSQIYASMLASGGLIKFGTQENTDRLRAQVAELGGVVLDKSGAERFFGQIKDLYDVYNEFGDRAENVNRAALYDALIKKKKTHAEAAFMARDLMDFSMGGSAPVVRFLTQTVPFLNARLVGLDKLGRAAIEDPRRFAAVTGAVALASLALMAGYSDDEDWKKREDWDRDAYWWFKIGGQAYRIPKPFEVGAIGTLAERTAELMFNDEMTGKRYMERVSHMLSGTFSFNPVPQAFKPLLDLYANKDSFTGRAIESQADQRLRPQDRYSERTPEVAKFLGGLGLPDPAQLVKGEYSALSPKQVEHLIRGYFSWVGTAAMTVSDFGLRPLAGRGERPDMRLKDVFIAGNFVENLPTGSSRYVTQMYEQSRQVEQAYASYQDAIKAGDTEKAQSIKESAEPLLRNRPAYTAATRQLAEINRTAKRIEADQAMAGADKRARLTQLEQQRQVIAQRVSRLAAATP